ncbi:MAG: hypothetical protein IM565_02290 [Pseudanabaena sp. M109S1SP2A07QC]|nr:hypothetical protein [Pseudanabaena sp. M109S1SP2A07QC]
MNSNDKVNLGTAVKKFYDETAHKWFSFYQYANNIVTGVVILGSTITIYFGLFDDSNTQQWLFRPKFLAGVGGVLVALGNTSNQAFKIQEKLQYYTYLNYEAYSICLLVDTADEDKLKKLNDRYEELVSLQEDGFKKKIRGGD